MKRVESPTLVAWAAAVVGLIGIVSASTPAMADRYDFVRGVLPQGFPAAARVHETPMQRKAWSDVPVGIELPKRHAVAFGKAARGRAAERRRDLQLDHAVHHRDMGHGDRAAGDERGIADPRAVADRDAHLVPGEVGGDSPATFPGRGAVGRADLHDHPSDGTVLVELEFAVPPSDEGPSIHAVGDQTSGPALDTLDGDGVVTQGGHETIVLGGRCCVAGEEEEHGEK